MKEKNVSRRNLLFSLFKTIPSSRKTISIYSIDDILNIRFVWRPHTKWAENNDVLSVSDDNDALLFSEELTDIMLYVSRNMDGTRNIAELCEGASNYFSAEMDEVHEDVLYFVCLALKKKIIKSID